MNRLQSPPLSLYIHIPWCERKCPYCDFNSHQRSGALPDRQYVDCLLADLQLDADLVCGRTIESVFLGGGTPSLMPPASIERLLAGIKAQVGLSMEAEITMEANPGTLNRELLREFRSAGINRLSLGIQSFDDRSLQRLGRIHNARQAREAIDHALLAGFTNLNLDLMYGLPDTTTDDVLSDLQIACAWPVPHLSWYQLTIEPNTVFHSSPPSGLPDDERLWQMYSAGHERLAERFTRYEISAWSAPGRECHHNLNYWRFGDYLGIGAGAHGKATLVADRQILRTRKTRVPDHYMAGPGDHRLRETIPAAELPMEFLLNCLRLRAGVNEALFESRTGLPLSCIEVFLDRQRRRGLLQPSPLLCTTDQGYLFLDSLLTDLAVFLEESSLFSLEEGQGER